MRKQTKLVAVLSTAALLALGASMSSFAATGWQEENGTWVYYDKSGDLTTEQWKPSGDNWFWLNEDGEMATDTIVENNDQYYYVDANGAMVANQWVAVENEDYGDDDSEPTNYWYYFGSNGKAYKNTSDKAVFKTVNGKKYVFNDEGQMQYGWIDDEGSRLTEDDAWATGVYYCGDENDGAQRANQWEYLNITADDDVYGEGLSSLNVFDDEDQTRWFWFKSNGKKIHSTDEKFEESKTINGAKYSFDEYGRMNAEWVIYGTEPATASQSGAYGDVASYSESWSYYRSPEDGARVTKGWFKVVPDYYLNSGDNDDDKEAWYYADGDGDLVAAEIKTINGKKYAFDKKGKMQSGLKFYALEGSKTITDIKANDNDDYPFETPDEFKENANYWLNKNYKAYYFSTGDDGSMQTGKQTLGLDGENKSFLFNKSGSYKGAGKTGEDSNKYYLAGMLLAADKEDKYAVLKITTDGNGTHGDKYEVLTTEKFLDEKNYVTPDIDEQSKPENFDEHYKVNVKKASDDGISYRLINTAGTVQKSKSKAKAGDDYFYSVDASKNVTSLYVED